MAREDEILDESTEDDANLNSKEWASSFTVAGVPYAASVFWESLQNVDAPFLDAKDAAENVLVGADLFCVKHGKSPQLGLAISSQGFKKGMNVAAVTAVTMRCGAMPPQDVKRATMMLDRPFIYAIKDRVTDTMIFVGTVGNPNKK